MNIPPKYEDLVLKVAEMERCETALRESLTDKREEYNKLGDRYDALQQRLTVAEQRLSQVEGACDLAMSAIDDGERGANFVKIIQAIKDKAALKPAAEVIINEGR